VQAPSRRLEEIRIGVDDADDLARAAASLRALGIEAGVTDSILTTADKTTGVRVELAVTPRRHQPAVDPTPYNGPGRHERQGTRAPGILRDNRVRPRKLGHVVIGSTDFDASTAFFRDGLGLKASDYIVWGLGRHHAGSNFFYYFKDPAGTFSEYYSDLDCVPEDQLWTPETFEGAKGLFSWGPPPPPSFLAPDDLADLMAGSHSSLCHNGLRCLSRRPGPPCRLSPYPWRLSGGRLGRGACGAVSE
jgi:catechol 2,3-dioxygenase-like lactoylglutathione lyase family enzyme